MEWHRTENRDCQLWIAERLNDRTTERTMAKIEEARAKRDWAQVLFLVNENFATLSPTSPPAWCAQLYHYRAHAYAKLSNYHAALENYTNALVLNTTAHGFWQRAFIYEALHQYEEAVNDLIHAQMLYIAEGDQQECRVEIDRISTKFSPVARDPIEAVA